jgi:hypothetical protein
MFVTWCACLTMTNIWLHSVLRVPTVLGGNATCISVRKLSLRWHPSCSPRASYHLHDYSGRNHWKLIVRQSSPGICELNDLYFVRRMILAINLEQKPRCRRRATAGLRATSLQSHTVVWLTHPLPRYGLLGAHAPAAYLQGGGAAVSSPSEPCAMP